MDSGCHRNILHQPVLSFESPLSVPSQGQDGNGQFSEESAISFKEMLSRGSEKQHADGGNIFASLCDDDNSEDLVIDMHILSPDVRQVDSMTTVAHDNHNQDAVVDSLQLLRTCAETDADTTLHKIQENVKCSEGTASTVFMKKSPIEVFKEKIAQFAVDFKVQFVVFGCIGDTPRQPFSHAVGCDALKFHKTHHCQETFQQFCEGLLSKPASNHAPPDVTCSDSPTVGKTLDIKSKKRKRKTYKCANSNKKHANFLKSCSLKVLRLAKVQTETPKPEQREILQEKKKKLPPDKPLLTAESELDSFQKFRCKLCDYRTHFKKNLQEHETVHLKPSKKCTFCNMAFTNEDELRWHEKFTHRCSNCENTFSSLMELRAHEQLHKVDKLICKFCNRKFTRVDSLERHVSIHKGSRPHRCVTCNKSFTRLDSLQKHQLVHQPQRPYVCDVCGKGLTRLEYLISHKRIHSGDRPFMCENCGKQYYSMTELNKHNKRCSFMGIEQPMRHQNQPTGSSSSQQHIQPSDSESLFDVPVDFTSFSIPEAFLTHNSTYSVDGTQISGAGDNSAAYSPKPCGGGSGIIAQSLNGVYANEESDESNFLGSYFHESMW